MCPEQNKKGKISKMQTVAGFIENGNRKNKIKQITIRNSKNINTMASD